VEVALQNSECRWHEGFNPNLVFVMDHISTMGVKKIGSVIPSRPAVQDYRKMKYLTFDFDL